MLRMRRSMKRKIGIAMLSVVVGAVLLIAGGIVGNYRAKQSYEAVLEEKDARLRSAERMVYITTKEVKAGERFSEDNTELRYLLSEQAEEGLVTEVIGRVACTDLSPGVILHTALCGEAEVSETERKCVFEDIEQVEMFPDHSVVDVRIRYPNGENYCVLGRKVLWRGEDAESCCLSLTEEEQLLMSAARYDAEIYDGTVLYVVAFLEERLQEEGNSRYIPSEQVTMQLQHVAEDMVVTDEWYGLRKALEERLRKNREQREENLF